MPDEDEQTALLRQVVDAMDGRPVTVRTLDAGGDKLGALVDGRVGPNPALGLRAIRLSLARTDLFDTQLAAILRASAYGPVRILLPMICTTDELTQARRIMDGVVRRLERQRVPLPDPLPPLGVMIEVPGAALAADALAHHADFFAIGTNDLTQYTLAIDRSDDSVAHLYNPLHPAVLRLVQFAGEAANRAGIPVSICGEMAGDPRPDGPASGPWRSRVVHVINQHSAREGTHLPDHHGRGHAPRHGGNDGVGPRPYRRAAGRLQRHTGIAGTPSFGRCAAGPRQSAGTGRIVVAQYGALKARAIDDGPKITLAYSYKDIFISPLPLVRQDDIQPPGILAEILARRCACILPYNHAWRAP